MAASRAAADGYRSVILKIFRILGESLPVNSVDRQDNHAHAYRLTIDEPAPQCPP